jgi:hypothetical protein
MAAISRDVVDVDCAGIEGRVAEDGREQPALFAEDQRLVRRQQ